jgi:hypothetical protein
MKNLHFHPSEVRIVTLNDSDHTHLIKFCRQLLLLPEGQKELIHNISMSEEAYFRLSRFEHKQNYSYWSDSNTNELHENHYSVQRLQ